MITNLNIEQKRKNDINILIVLVLTFILTIWFCTVPGSKIANLCFYGNNTQYFIAKITNKDINEYKFHQNNAIYLTKMNQKKTALREINQAIQTAPTYITEHELNRLYRDRAMIRLYFKEYKGALEDFLKLPQLDFNDRLKVAQLYKKIGNNKYALSYCNSILDIDPQAYAGYACIADVYAIAGKPHVSVKVYNMLIDRVPNRSKYYLDRAHYKKICGDIEGANIDLEQAEIYSTSLRGSNFSIIDDAINPKTLELQTL